jgi:hypothetical protein
MGYQILFLFFLDINWIVFNWKVGLFIEIGLLKERTVRILPFLDMLCIIILGFLDIKNFLRKFWGVVPKP